MITLTSDDIKHATSIVKSVLPKHKKEGDFEDILQDGMLAMCRAAKEYSEDKGASFWYFTSNKIRWAVIDVLRKRKQNITLFSELGDGLVSGEDVASSIAIDQTEELFDVEDAVVAKDFAMELRNEFGEIVDLLSNGFSQKEIAKKLNISQPTICRRVATMRKRLKHRLLK